MDLRRSVVAAVALLGLASGQDPAGPLSPKDALKAFRLQPGFRIDLVAAEPDVMDPVAMAFDEDGRIYVAEMADYPLGPPSGRIRLLEDTDGDGKIDRVSLFVDKVPYPTGVMPWRGGVLVTAAPDIWFFKDTDGDGKADVRQVVFTGFAEGNQQHRVNGLQFAYDNWIYGTNGDSGGTVRPGNADGPKVSISGRDYRFRGDYSGFEGAAGRGQFSNTFDDWGNRFINDNSNHIRHTVLPLKYLARNPNLAVANVEEGISDHGGSSVVFPTSKLQERPNDHFAAGHFTSACSPTIYRGASFGPEVQGNVFCCEPVHNLVHRDLLVPKGASFVAKRAYEKEEFLSSTDNWCRPVNLCSGPDGALYVVDMYRAIIEHPQWIPLEMQKRVDLRAGSDKGRLYRVSAEGAKAGARPKMSTQSAPELVAHFESPNGWWRSTAQRLLIERQDKSAVEPLRKLARESASPLARFHALWTLEGLGALDEAAVAAALKDPDPGVREHALRLAEPRLADSAALREAVLAFGAEPSPRVRFQLAFTLGYIDGERALDLLASLLVKDVEDKWTRVAALSSLKDAAPKLLAKLPPDFLDKAGAATLDLVRQLGELAGASRDEAQIGAWLRALTAGAGAPARWRLLGLSSLGPSLRRGGLKLDALLEASGSAARVNEWKTGLLETAVDAGRDVTERVSAMDMLSLLPAPGMAAAFEKLLNPLEPPQVQVAAVRSLGTDGAARLLDGWSRYTAPVRREVLSACLAKPGTMEGIVDRLEKGEIRVVELEPHQKEALLKHPNKGVQERVRKALAAKSDRDQVIEEIWTKVSTLKGDALAGEKVYMTSCATCHRMHGQGFEVGPSLSSVAGREKKALLTDILDPNRAVAPQFQVYLVKIPGARDPVSGIIASETPTSITLRRANAEETTVLRRDILEIKAYTASLMPEGVEANVNAQNFADLLEFLQQGKK
ncbi:MAG TPA: PVC-type heme-binding CxxCH protein [Planctomycetota bacterium]|nr:PVC-type heme-binding CxxCH protein [Planctomycetota bacterium]